MKVGNHTATQVNGAWIYKADQAPSALQKKVKAVYKDPYQLPVMEKYEKFAKARFQEQLAKTVKEIVLFIKDIA